MKTSLFIGVAVMLFMLTMAQSVNDYKWLVLICGGIGILSCGLAGVLAAIPSKKKMGTETDPMRQSSLMWALNLVFFALPNVVAGATGLFLI